jgi:hypothetical protein
VLVYGLVEWGRTDGGKTDGFVAHARLDAVRPRRNRMWSTESRHGGSNATTWTGELATARGKKLDSIKRLR